MTSQRGCCAHNLPRRGYRRAKQRVTSLLKGGGVVAQPGNVTCWRFNPRGATRDVPVRGGGLHIAQPGKVTCLRFNSRNATRDVIVVGGGLHITQQRYVTMLVVTCALFSSISSLRAHVDRNECAPFIILLLR